jgi:RNA polymerase sigma-70 factor, ECF subfamily
MGKRLLKRHTSSQKGNTPVDEPLARVPAGKSSFNTFQQKTETKTVYHIEIPELSFSSSLLAESLFKPLQSMGDEDFERFSLAILDARFCGEFCSTISLPSTFERLVYTYQAYLLSLAYQILENWHAAEDVVQETWAKTFASLKRRCERGEQVDLTHMRGFLGVATRNTAYTYREREHLLRFVPLEAPDGEKIGELEAIESDKLEQPEFHFIQNESRADLGALLQCLPINYRMVIVLRFYYDHSLEETAKILKRPIGTVKCYQNRGLRKLRQTVQDREMIPEDFDVWNNYSRRDSWLWDHMMRYKDAQNIA